MMEELTRILADHARKYPLMQPADAVKLIYQNEFGGGHLIRDEQACMERLRREYDGIVKDPAQARYEPIGNGIVRVALAAVRPEELEQLGRAFIRSAAMHTGSMERFLQKLEVLTRMTEQGSFSFDVAALQAYLQDYRRRGCPPVSHSDAYRRAYCPAYRIILMPSE